MMKIVHVQSECVVPIRKKSKKEKIQDAAVEVLSTQRAIDRIKAREKFTAEIKQLEVLEANLNKKIADNNLQYYQFTTI